MENRQASPAATLRGIALRREARGPMLELDEAEISASQGVVGDTRGRPGKRQVTVLAVEDWRAACAELDRELPWTARRANLLVEGLSLADTRGATLRIGDVQLRVTGETDPCSRMDQCEPGLQEALRPHWRGGVCCSVVAGGAIAVGDRVTLEPAK